MSECVYSLDSYLTLIKMSNKKRLLVEGRSDRIHLTNLLNEIGAAKKIKIDTAKDLRGIDKQTSKNNRAKIEYVHARAGNKENIYFLCDREFREFVIDDKLHDNLPDHFNDKTMFWTLGHSLENYFFSIDVIIDSFKYLCFSEYKKQAAMKFREVLEASFKLIASITLAAKEMDKSTYPLSVIKWGDFTFEDDSFSLKDYAQLSWERNELNQDLFSLINKYLNVTRSADIIISSRISRGHTGVIVLQRIFSACLYEVGRVDNEVAAREAANEFSSLAEKNISTALSESWSRKVKVNEALYPELLINKFAI
ncbi:DUF4435 domain-containing protein [Pantoea agglomerans]|uniref:DUF4435 domain-containing protein n=1 Tax=Enterobacter agglomerans TaxID=549 RepID=UPI002A69F3D9|nr:DUF4435 domain-containing protein [Pantoea agglomerans]MDY1000134.1 DUF4435 domain-containing protein [Pantoea agglomerans]